MITPAHSPGRRAAIAVLTGLIMFGFLNVMGAVGRPFSSILLGALATGLAWLLTAPKAEITEPDRPRHTDPLGANSTPRRR